MKVGTRVRTIDGKDGVIRDTQWHDDIRIFTVCGGTGERHVYLGWQLTSLDEGKVIESVIARLSLLKWDTLYVCSKAGECDYDGWCPRRKPHQWAQGCSEPVVSVMGSCKGATCIPVPSEVWRKAEIRRECYGPAEGKVSYQTEQVEIRMEG